MLDPEEYRRLDASGLAEAIRQGRLSPEQALELAGGRIDSWQPSLNAITWLDMDGARRQLDSLDRAAPFAGVPLLLKDLRPHDFAGMPTSDGSAAYRDRVMQRNSDLVQRLVQAGFIVLGKTSTPEFALKATTEPAAFGPCRNPWHPDFIPGGSSGGSAAAVAAGIVPVATASDGGGSIRIPAAYCGLFGLKPTRGRVSQGPELSHLWDGLICDHVLTRSVRDSARLLDILSGPSALDPCTAAPPARRFADACELAPGGLRIALWKESPLGGELDPDHLRVLDEVVATLRELGHRVSDASPKVDGEQLAHCYLMVYAGCLAAEVRTLARERGAGALGELELDTRVLAALGESYTAGDYVAARRLWQGFSRALAEIFAHHDLVLSPTTAQPPARIGEQALPWLEATAARASLGLGLAGAMRATGLVDRLARQQLSRVPFTQLANFTGTPAASVPAGRCLGGTLPVGVQFMAAAGREDLLLSVGAQLEKARPWRLPAPQW